MVHRTRRYFKECRFLNGHRLKWMKSIDTLYVILKLKVNWPYPYWDGAIPLLLPYTFVGWTGTALPLPLSFSALEWLSLPDKVPFVSMWMLLFLLTFWKVSAWLIFSNFPLSLSLTPCVQINWMHCGLLHITVQHTCICCINDCNTW